MLLKFYHLQKCVFLSLVLETVIYTSINHGNATFNIKLILLSDIHRIICAFKNLHMTVLMKLILSAAMIILWIFYFLYIPFTISNLFHQHLRLSSLQLPAVCFLVCL